MTAALILLLVGLGAMAAGILVGRYYVPDDRQLRRTARHSKAYMRALSHLIARDHETAITELREVVEENVDDVEPYFALGAMFRSRGEHERAIRVHQALAVRERDKRKLRQRAMFELGLDFRAAGMPRRATRAMEEVLLEEPNHEAAVRVLAALYEEQARFNEAATLWQRLGKKRSDEILGREHHLLVAAAQAALGRADVDSAKQLLKAAQKHRDSAHLEAATAELAAARGNHANARDRLKQALVLEPALVPHLLPGLIAAEQGILATEQAGKQSRVEDELAEPEPTDGETKQLPAGDGETALATTEAAVMSTKPATPPAGVPLVPPGPKPEKITQRVLAVLAEVEQVTGPRLELSLIRAQLVPPADHAAQQQLAKDLVTRFPDALAARVATARLALASNDPTQIRAGLEVFVAEQGALAWTLRGRWQCAHCGNRPGPFSWRCGQCRKWGTLKMETGIEPPPVQPRERRSAPRSALGVGDDRERIGLLGAAPDESLPAATLDPGLTEDELARAGTRRSLLGKVGGWFGGVWRRDRAR